MQEAWLRHIWHICASQGHLRLLQNFPIYSKGGLGPKRLLTALTKSVNSSYLDNSVRPDCAHEPLMFLFS